ncbi:MAG: alpha-glucosidase C-terminal domain-containing protein, partial [Bacteroidia bacterium]|nr:alpha-glucosidase C-terminal domain-containing protein [Bacteroidia bacterium]
KDKQVLAFKRELGTNSVVVVLNMTPEPVTINLSPDSISGKYTDFFSGSMIKPSSSPISLKPWGYYIFTK